MSGRRPACASWAGPGGGGARRGGGATAELTTRDGLWLGVRAHHFALPVAGGLGGLVVDTREIPLRLPERPERRRDLLDAWQRPLWAGGDPCGAAGPRPA